MEFLGGLHKLVIHFPIALLLTYCVLEFIGMFLKESFVSKTAFLILFLGIIGSVAAVLTGNQAEKLWLLWNPESREVLHEHEKYATMLLWYFTLLLGLRTHLVLKKKFTGRTRLYFIPLILLGAFLIYKTGEEGGEMVYKHGVGIETLNNRQK
ncbi:MAG TPA: DUF2231 domain-containing protein [Ignavibacteriales bacterium]|nr:DUF2231 domain-containing protein [Ignavibacteriales bacterium]